MADIDAMIAEYDAEKYYGATSQVVGDMAKQYTIPVEEALESINTVHIVAEY